MVKTAQAMANRGFSFGNIPANVSGRSKVSDLKRRGVLDGAVISSIGRKTVFDVKTAMRLVSEYQSNNK